MSMSMSMNIIIFIIIIIWLTVCFWPIYFLLNRFPYNSYANYTIFLQIAYLSITKSNKHFNLKLKNSKIQKMFILLLLLYCSRYYNNCKRYLCIHTRTYADRYPSHRYSKRRIRGVTVFFYDVPLLLQNHHHCCNAVGWHWSEVITPQTQYNNSIIIIIRSIVK